MVKEAEANAEVDNAKKAAVEAKNKLESYLYSVRGSVVDNVKINDSEKESILNLVSETLRWIETNPSASLSDYNEMQQKVENFVRPILSSIYKGESPSEPSVEEVE